MSDRPIPSPTEIRAIYTRHKRAEELHGNWAVVVLHRPSGFWLAHRAILAGISPTTITLISAVCLPLLPLVALGLPLALAAVVVMLLGHAILVLDCADGDVARATGKTSRAGAELDMLTDTAFWGALYLAIGLIADRATGGGFGWSALALIAAWVRLFARMILDRIALGGPHPHQEDKAAILPPSGLREWTMAGMNGLNGTLPFLALGALWSPWAVAALLILSIGDLVLSIHSAWHHHRLGDPPS